MYEKHYKSHTPEYQAWVDMRARCTDKRRRDYRRYGGRGIRVSRRWSRSFETFFKDMGPRPSPSHSLDRKDNDLGYYKGNCRWATKKEQMRNKSSNRFLTIDGISKTLAEWAEIVGKEQYVIFLRLKRGHSDKDAVFAPMRKDRPGKYDYLLPKIIELKRRGFSRKQIAAALKIKYAQTITAVLKSKGLPYAFRRK